MMGAKSLLNRLSRKLDWASVKSMCNHEAKQATKQLHVAFADGDQDCLQSTFEYLQSLQQLRIALAQLPEDVIGAIDSEPSTDAPTTFVTTAFFLKQCYELVIAQPEETVFFVGGPQVGETALLTQRIHFKLRTQTITRATADPSDQSRAYALMSAWDLKFWAHFHSHPGVGPGVLTPSTIDTRFQSTLENLGHTQAIGAIFARGHDTEFYVRFWPTDKQFDIKIQGSGVIRREDKLFEIRPPEGYEVPMPKPAD